MNTRRVVLSSFSAVMGGAAAGALAACGQGASQPAAVKPGSRPAQLRLHVRAGSETDTLDVRIPVTV